MALDGNKMLQNMKRLSEAANMKQVKPSSYALFPGYHCPLMGAMMTINEIDNSVMVVIGPDECAYYTKLATDGGGPIAANDCEIMSVVLNQHDVTFGCQEKMDEAFAELMDEFKPQVVYFVTTCVVEVIGDDIDAMAEGYSQQYGLPVVVVHAENFKTDDHMPGIEHTLDASIQLMEEQEISDCVNVLGMRLGDFRKTEAFRYLKESGIALHLQLPGKTTAETVRTAPRAKCNIVAHPVGLPLARAMEEKFGTPYVVFERFSDPDRIMGCYRKLFSILEQELPEELARAHAAMAEKTADTRKILSGKTYISGNTALSNYEPHAFLAEKLDVKPLLLQISDMDDDSIEFRNMLLTLADPYVTRAANLAALPYLYPLLRPDFNIGSGNPTELRKNAIASVRMMKAYNTLGFEVCGMVLDAFIQADKELKMMKHGMPHGHMNAVMGGTRR